MRERIVVGAVSLLLVIAVCVGSLSAPGGADASAPSAYAAGNNLNRADGRPFFMLGANYVGAPDRSWTMWQDSLFDTNLIDRDFARAKATGLNTLRIFVRAPLPQQLLAGNWSKLDAVVGLAEKHGLALIITLYDYREDDLAKAAALDRAVAARYAGRGIVLAYDLKNEPHYQDLAIAIYPGEKPPLQKGDLIAHYGERVTLQAAEAWRQEGEGKTLVPARFSAEEAHVYANNYRYYQEFLADSGAWVEARGYNVSTLDYLASPDSAKWQPLAAALDATLAAWLRPQVEAVRAVDGGRLITVGYSDAILADLQANATLGLVSFHRFPNAGLRPLQVSLSLLDDLRRAFPGKPVVFEEFGYATAQVEESRAAVYEAAIMLHLLSQGMAGGAKWSLYDVAQGWSERENSFGLYRADGTAKPSAVAMRAISAYVAAVGVRPPTGGLRLEAEPGGPGIRYVYTASDAMFVGGTSYVDPAGRLSMEGAGAGLQVFASWPKGNEIAIASVAPATVRLDPGALTGRRGTRALSLKRADGSAVPFERQGSSVVFQAEGGATYTLAFNAEAADARIEIVYPHDGLAVSQATLANVGAYLFSRDDAQALCGQPPATVRLWRSLGSGVAAPVAVGEARTAREGGQTFTAYDFNNVDVSAARDLRQKVYFRLSVDGLDAHTSVWSHAEDARTYQPQQETPSGVTASAPGAVDAKIQIVYPHDGLPVAQATKANVGATLFARGGSQAVPPEWSPTVRLWRSLNNGYGEPVAVGTKVLRNGGGLVYPVWEFNDVDVSDARDPLNKYYFWVSVEGADSRSNVWSHGADARTYFPQMDVPTGVSPCG